MRNCRLRKLVLTELSDEQLMLIKDKSEEDLKELGYYLPTEAESIADNEFLFEREMAEVEEARAKGGTIAALEKLTDLELVIKSRMRKNMLTLAKLRGFSNLDEFHEDLRKKNEAEGRSCEVLDDMMGELKDIQ